MATSEQRKQALDDIRQSISRSGRHIYLVFGGATPRFSYTIGLSESVGTELVLAGAVFYMKDEVQRIIDDTVSQLTEHRDRRVCEVAGLGSFALRSVDSSWASELMLGAFDYYQKKDIPALQIIPDKDHWTVDVPNMTLPWNATQQPVWKWLREPWAYRVSQDSEAITDLAALRGGRITEACRWEENEWELFAGAGPDVSKEEMRIVPLGTLLAVDPSLEAVLTLPIGTGLWRDSASDWHPWVKKEQVNGSQRNSES